MSAVGAFIEVRVDLDDQAILGRRSEGDDEIALAGWWRHSVAVERDGAEAEGAQVEIRYVELVGDRHDLRGSGRRRLFSKKMM